MTADSQFLISGKYLVEKIVERHLLSGRFPEADHEVLPPVLNLITGSPVRNITCAVRQIDAQSGKEQVLLLVLDAHIVREYEISEALGFPHLLEESAAWFGIGGRKAGIFP